MIGASQISAFPRLDFSSLAWLSISKGCENKGNLLIEYALRKILNVKQADVEVTAFSELTEEAIHRINSCRLMVLPGATLLDPVENLALRKLNRIVCDKFAVGVAFCTRDGKVNLAAARSINLPIGSRDPFTHERLRSAGLKSYFVGCPTLFLGRASRWKQQEGPIIISLGPGPQRSLQECVTACAVFDNVILLEHVPRLQPRFPLPANIRRIEIKSAVQAVEIYASAAAVLTGRIHGYLTCLSLGVPVVFFSSWYDSRFSLLEFLGTQIHEPEPNKITGIIDKMLNGAEPPISCLRQAEELRTAMTKYLNRFEIAG
jgi:hypothetical protein